MPPSESAAGSAPEPVVSLDDPRVVQILATEHWSLLASRSLAYNEAFTRGGMFLAFLSTSFVALALLAQAMSFGDVYRYALIVVALAALMTLSLRRQRSPAGASEPAREMVSSAL